MSGKTLASRAIIHTLAESRQRCTAANFGRSVNTQVLDLLLKAKHDLEQLPPNASDEEAEKIFANLRGPLMDLNKCQDFVVNRGHYFGTSYATGEPPLSDAEKKALIEYLKTF